MSCPVHDAVGSSSHPQCPPAANPTQGAGDAAATSAWRPRDLIFLAIFAAMAIAARSGVRSVSIEQIHAAYSMGATRLQVIRHVILKSATGVTSNP